MHDHFMIRLSKPTPVRWIILVGILASMNTLADSVPARLSHADLHKPTDIVMFDGQYVTTELMSNQLAIFGSRDLDATGVRHFNPASIGEKYHNPHFLAVTTRGSLLVSSGWGTSIVEITALDGRGWKEFHGKEPSFNAPHGVATDSEGWIYVGDSLNSRIARFRGMDGEGWDVFKDHDRVVSYNRQLLYKHGSLWVSNSYEDRPGLNPGKGGNVLRISDWDSGKAEVVYANSNTNITGICPGNRGMYVGLWGDLRSIVWVDLRSGVSCAVPDTQCELGVPYGMYEDPSHGDVIATYFGGLENEKESGGLMILRHPDQFSESGATKCE